MTTITNEIATEIVKDGRHPTKEERRALGIEAPLQKGWLRQLRARLAIEFDIQSERYGKAIERGVLLRGRCRGMTLQEADVASLHGFQGSARITHAELLQIKHELRRRGVSSSSGHASDKAIQTCVFTHGMGTDDVIAFFERNGITVTAQQIQSATK